MTTANKLKIALIAFILLGSYSFTSIRNSHRALKEIEVFLVDNKENKDLFLNPGDVKNVLAEKIKKGLITTKDGLILSTLETFLKANKLIEDVQVYVSAEGVISVNVKQKTPIMRVQADPAFYIDDKGGKMPLSDISSARVFVCFGWKSDRAIEELYPIALAVSKDVFLKTFISGMWKQGGDYMFSTRFPDINIRFGEPKDIAMKFSNLKAFYSRAIAEKTLSKYSEINLKYKGQVVCRKNKIL